MHWTQCTVVAQFDGASPRPAQRFTPESFLAWVAAQQTEAHEVHSCYEAGAFGYGLHRRLVALGIKNVVVRPRDWDEYHKKVKTGRRDAPALCGMLVRWQALLLEMDRQIAALTALIEAADAGERPVGVGALTAGTLDREAGDWRRFQNRREV
ncbi:MAG: hypothetical protein LBC18_00405, partial [Opitutaceae bacterium]|nr:hypothetical protein [Opitutaceae bacterium]